MNVRRELGIHLLLLLAAGGAATRVWVKEGVPEQVQGTISVWHHPAATLQKVSWDSDKNDVQLERKTDEQGAYLTGTSAKMVARLSADQKGAPTPQREVTEFVSRKTGLELASQLSDLVALRSLGLLPKEREASVGLNAPSGKLHLVFSDGEESLTAGSTAAGGGERFLRRDSTGIVYAISEDLFRDLTWAESRLLERELHDFETQQVAAFHWVASDRQGAYQALGAERGFAEAGQREPSAKAARVWELLSQLRVTGYASHPSPAPTNGNLVLEVTYRRGTGAPLGFLELYRVGTPSTAPGSVRFYARTEASRWYAEVLASTAEALVNELGPAAAE